MFIYTWIVLLFNRVFYFLFIFFFYFLLLLNSFQASSQVSSQASFHRVSLEFPQMLLKAPPPQFLTSVSKTPSLTKTSSLTKILTDHLFTPTISTTHVCRTWDTRWCWCKSENRKRCNAPGAAMFWRQTSNLSRYCRRLFQTYKGRH